MSPRYPGWFSATFSGTTFFSVGPPPVGNGDLVVFWPVLGGGHLGKFRARAENRKTQFPGARGTFGSKTGCPKGFSEKRWSQRVIYWGCGPFWAVGPRSKPEKRDFPELGALLEKTVCPKIFSQKLRNFFTYCVLADRTPQGREIAKYWFCPKGAPTVVVNGFDRA